MRENIALSKVAQWEIGKSYSQLHRMAIHQTIPAWRQDGRWMINKQQMINHIQSWSRTASRGHGLPKTTNRLGDCSSSQVSRAIL